jgi:hypothetical protein
VEAFERGDYARVRTDGPALALKSADERIRDAARVLVDRTKPDTLAVGLLALAAAFVAILSVWWVVHGHAPATPPAAFPR